MKKLRKPCLKSIISFVLAIALVMGAVPIDVLVMVARAEGTNSNGGALDLSSGDTSRQVTLHLLLNFIPHRTIQPKGQHQSPL